MTPNPAAVCHKVEIINEQEERKINEVTMVLISLILNAWGMEGGEEIGFEGGDEI